MANPVDLANLNITLQQFNSIASGKYNAGVIDFQTDANGEVVNRLVKVNNHVHSIAKNTTTLSHERIFEVKEAFVRALQKSGVDAKSLEKVREELGIPLDVSPKFDKQKDGELLVARLKPLTREKVRTLIDKYAQGANLPHAPEVTGARLAKQQAVNAAVLDAALGNRDFRLTDAISVLSTTRSLAEFTTAFHRRAKGEDAEGVRAMMDRDLQNAYSGLFSHALSLVSDDVRESPEFTIMGGSVKIEKGEDGRLVALIGKGVGATRMKMGVTAQELVGRLIGRAVKDRDTLGAGVVKEMLNKVYTLDIKAGLLGSDRTSLTRNFAALILEGMASPDVENPVFNVAGRDYNTGLLVQIAQRALAGELKGEKSVDSLDKLDAYYKQLRSDTANLPDDIKEVLEGVANQPIEFCPDDERTEFIVRQPIVNDINEAVAAIPPAPPIPVVPRGVTVAQVKDFVADLVFSGDTMVGDVVVDRPGETMRKMLSSDERILAFASILQHPEILDTAVAPQIAGVIKDGFAALKEKLDGAFRAANPNETLDQAMAKPDFVKRFSMFLRDSEKLPGDVLAGFDDVIDSMANSASVKIQDFINNVFKVHAQDGGVGIVDNPYKDMSPEQIKAELDGKSLNQILDAAQTSDVPGQVGLFKQVISTYFTSMETSDKRSCLAAALRYANVFDFQGKQGDDLESAQKAAVNKFTGAVLKGASPLLHKMMQGLPKEIMGEYADALDDMKSNLAPIPRKLVQGYLNKMIADSHGKIKSIKMHKSLGAASVGEAFLCTFKVEEMVPKMRQATIEEIQNGAKMWVPDLGEDGKPQMELKTNDYSLVVKIMRHDAERRVKKEAEIFTAAAAKIPGMAKTWEGQLKQYMKEFDFRTEAQNAEVGRTLYGIMDADAGVHPLKAIAPDVMSMKISKIAPPQKNVMVAEEMIGTTVDKYLKNALNDIRNASAAIFERDPETNRVKWRDGEIDPATGKPRKVPVLKQDMQMTDIIAFQHWVANKSEDFTKASDKVLQATKAWFYNALLGNGKFHGDTHSGNLMVTANQIGFIDFGNLYTLDKNRADGVNEQQELLRVILGASFRNKGFVLDGFMKLMSPEGKAMLAMPEIRAKAEAILDSVLSPTRGAFSFNIVYRLQAAVSELQKLGLELPPQINCFIQSMVRLSNTMAEINTIVNQCKLMMDTVAELKMPPKERDELDPIGKLFDLFMSEEGKVIVTSESQMLRNKEVPAFLDKLCTEDEFGGEHAMFSERFKRGGTYTVQITDRISRSQDAMQEAGRIADMIKSHLTSENDAVAVQLAENIDAALAKLGEVVASSPSPEARANAIREFADECNNVTSTTLTVIKSKMTDIYARGINTMKTPSSFASAITDILFDNFSKVSETLGDGQAALVGNARTIAVNELGVGTWASLLPNNVVNAIMEDAKKVGGDKSYQIDIGV